MATFSETSIQAQTIAPLYILPFIDTSAPGRAIERRRWPNA
jgi:hypothetical protein